MILGDLNAYSQEDPLAVLTDYVPAERGYTIRTAVGTGLDGGVSVPVTKTYGFTNVAEVFDPLGFSYWFFGNGLTGSLDHILVNSELLADIVGATHWNINAPEAFQLQYDQALRLYPDADGYEFTGVGPFRSSDHDPFIVLLDLPEAPIPGDIDGNGSIAFEDYMILLQAFGSDEGDARYQQNADLDSDGDIDFVDFQLWYQAWLTA